MSEYRQPWNRLRVDGRRCRLQVLDPSTAFEIEPDLVQTLGDTLSFAVAAPDEVLGAVWHSTTGGTDLDIRDVAHDPIRGPVMAAEAVASLGRVLAQCIASVPTDPRWARQMFEVMVLDRFKVGGDVVEETEDWGALGFRPIVKWQVMAAQIRQTFGPLWTRSPYTSSVRKKDYGIARPTSVPIAVQWADSLARLGSASSVNEILNEWTPVRMIEVVESAAYIAANEQRSLDAAREGSR